MKRRLERLEKTTGSKAGMVKVIEWLQDDRIVIRWEPAKPGRKPGGYVDWAVGSDTRGEAEGDT